MKYYVEIKDSVPVEYRDHVESWLSNAIDWLLAIPRPQSLPEIPQLIPSFEDIRFTICDHFNPPHGLFSRTKWTGYMFLPVRDNGDLVVWTKPHLTLFMDQDVELASMVSWVHLLDQMFLAYKDEELHLSRQLQYLQQHSPTLYEETQQKIKADRVQRRKDEQKWKRTGKSKPVAKHEPKQIAKPIAAPQVKPYAPSVKREPAPLPTVDEMTQRAIDQQRAFWDSVRDGMKQDSTACKS